MKLASEGRGPAEDLSLLGQHPGRGLYTENALGVIPG